MTYWLRRTLRRFGLDVPFRAVVCPEEVKTIAIDAQWHAKVTVRRMLVFLSDPADGDLRDIVPIDPDTDRESSIMVSPDAMDIGRRPVKSGTCVYWSPREPIVRYAAYMHQRSWSSPADDVRDVLYTEVHCQMRTGIMALEIIAPTAFQTAVAFKEPKWRRVGTERRLMKYALRQIDTARSRPIIGEARQRVEWRVNGPKVGDRYICIAFTAEGLEDWQRRVRETSFTGRLRRLLGMRPAADAIDPSGSPDRLLLPRS